MKADRWVNGATVLIALCAVVSTGLLARRELVANRPEARRSAPWRVNDWQRFARGGHTLGSAGAPVTIVVFSDFQCPYCGILMNQLRTLRQKYPSHISVVYRHFPVPSHPHAATAARASECAAEQGRFEPFHDALFEERLAIGLVEWTNFAREAAIPDLPRFEECVHSGRPIPALERDAADAQRLQVAVTPTYLVNDLRFQGVQPADSLEGYVQRAIREAEGRER
jgi:protein-disulfide isomerase